MWGKQMNRNKFSFPGTCRIYGAKPFEHPRIVSAPLSQLRMLQNELFIRHKMFVPYMFFYSVYKISMLVKHCILNSPQAIQKIVGNMLFP